MGKSFLKALALIVVLGTLVAAAAGYSIARRGLSTRTEPTAAEAVLARTMRRLATPAALRDRANPIEATPAVMEAALEHFADHCATCHANDGSGETAIGRNLYPRAPDMRERTTQQLSDGELFSIIENGVRLTGMPAWGTGTAESERESWALVHFVRRLPTLTAEEIDRMKALNPKTPAELRADEEARRFLAGEDAPSSAGPSGHSHGGPGHD